MSCPAYRRAHGHGRKKRMRRFRRKATEVVNTWEWHAINPERIALFETDWAVHKAALYKPRVYLSDE